MSKPVLLCPGQGAQAVGMGRAWFESSPDAARTFGAADELLGDRFGEKLSKICFDGPAELLNRTDVAQPALYVCGVASFQAEFGGADASALEATAGLSLGEYTALHLARAMSFEDGLNLVALRGRAMQDAAEASEGSMVALIGADEEQARALCEAVVSSGDSDWVLVPANFNAPGQIVISGSEAACDAAVAKAGESGLRATKLTVAGAFHSPLMQPAADRLAEALARTELDEPRCTVLSNVTGLPHAEHAAGIDPPDMGGPELIRWRLVRQLTAPVRWEQSCRWLVEHSGGELHELAPGKVLAGLMRRIDRSRKVTTHDQPV
jgi:[acyl-carrier-protein] S-malonyltransferase